MSDSGIVCRLTNIRPHPNADRLRLATVSGYQVITGLNDKEGELGIFFDGDTQLSHEYCIENGLYRKHPETGESMGGYLEPNRRVRTLKLRSSVSYGLWLPVSTLFYTGRTIFKEGDEISKIGKHLICNKYVTPATRNASRRHAKVRRNATKFFRKHFDTKQLKRDIISIPLGANIYFTEKLHGTSHRYGLVLDEIRPKWFGHHWAQHLGLSPKLDWSYLSGTRNVIIRDNYVGYYEDETFRGNASAHFRMCLHPGEIVYFEIVGFAGDKLIMNRQDTSPLPDIRKEYGDTMVYLYKCLPGQFDVYVYRMEKVDRLGHRVEYPWWTLKKRCNEMGAKVVPELTFMPRFSDHRDIQTLANQLCGGPSTIDGSHIREGVCIRYEHEDGFGILKHKNVEFLILEGVLKETPDYVDMEEAS